MSTEQTYGQKLVRANFNPSDQNSVDVVKSEVAKLIDHLNASEYKGGDPAEFDRLKYTAISYLESACMYAVKMLTTG